MTAREAIEADARPLRAQLATQLADTDDAGDPAWIKAV